MNPCRILVVDDELINLEIIREYLEDAHYELDLMTSADAAWSRMAAGACAYDLVVLDRMMPGMSGIELLRKMKADDRYRGIPVIMQTAAGAPDQVREGIEAGAFYYLVKPYDPGTLLGIVRAALADIEERKESNRHASAHVQAMELLESAEFRFSRIEEIGSLIEVLASLCPNPERTASGLTELLMNAVEHGNLGISYAEKKRLRLENVWEAEVARRQALPENADRKVRVRVQRHSGYLEFAITDEGCGFDWQRYLEFDPERMADPNGRGIAMARRLSFDSLQYQGSGNAVVATVRSI